MKEVEDRIIENSINKTVGEVQVSLFKLLQYFDQVCKNHQIEYWLDGGTFLGAVRHGGFIPWDDDLDVCVHQSDYERLISILNKEVSTTNRYMMYNKYRIIPHFTDYLADISLLKTYFLLPVNIDIIRIKSIEDDSHALSNDKRKINVLKHFERDKNFDPALNENHSEAKYLSKFKFTRKAKYYKNFMHNYLPSLPSKREGLLFNYCFNSTYVKREREYYKYTDIFPLTEVEFEGQKFPCPSNQERYLTILYGSDYMAPPPKEMQLPASKFIIRNYLPKPFLKIWIVIVYILKAIRNSITL